MEPRKYNRYDLNLKRRLFFRIGLVVSLLLVITAFEWEFKEYTAPLALPEPAGDAGIVILPTTQPDRPPPPRPKKMPENPLEKPGKLPELPPELIKPVALGPDTDFNSRPLFTLPEDPETVETGGIFIRVEKQPEPFGGWEKFYEYVAENLNYPRRAQKMGLEGVVKLQFIIDKDGSVREIRVLEGVGGGCNEEAVRILSNAPKWNPGKQRGIPVKVRMELSLVFRLK